MIGRLVKAASTAKMPTHIGKSGRAVGSFSQRSTVRLTIPQGQWHGGLGTSTTVEILHAAVRVEIKGLEEVARETNAGTSRCRIRLG